MNRPLEGRTVMVTGAGGAIASVIVAELRAAGARLVLVERAGHHRETVEGDEVVEADLSHPEGTRGLEVHAVDALVHTVGAFGMQKAHEATPEDLRRMFALNVDTLVHTVRAVLPGMLTRGSGVLIGIGAGQAARGAGPGAALYTAAKSAVAAYLASLDAELKGQGIRAAVVVPMGAVDTTANREAGMKPEAMIDPLDLAQSIVHLLARSERSFVSEIKITPRG